MKLKSLCQQLTLKSVIEIDRENNEFEIQYFEIKWKNSTRAIFKKIIFCVHTLLDAIRTMT